MPKYDLLSTTISVTTNAGKSILKKLFFLGAVGAATGALIIVGFVALIAAIIR